MGEGKALSGRTIHIYEIGTELGRGGMGTVYRARTTEDGPAGPAGTVVAVKILAEDLVLDEQTFERFKREAELGMRIRNPHVVPTFDVRADIVDEEIRNYIVMELVDGQTLRDLIYELGSLPEHLILQLTEQVLDALDAIHAENMVHRDLKPENLILTSDNRLLLMDLGVARLQQEGRDLTRAGEFIGSLFYASPEQFTDQDHVGVPADIYGLGVVLYEMATGRNPFEGAELQTLLMQKLKGSVRRPRNLARSLDPFLDEVILACMKTDPEDRFGSCAEMRSVLQAGIDGAWWQDRTRGDALSAAASALARVRPPRAAALVARAGQLDRLHELFEEVQDDAGRTVLVTGPAGVGKSRLVHDFLEDLVVPHGPRILVGRCGAPGSASPFAEAFSDLPEAEPAADPVEMLRAAARARPIVVLLEDLHSAHDEDLDRIAELARSLSQNPVLLVLTVRDDEVSDGSVLHALVTETGQRTEAAAVSVRPFSLDQTEQLVRGLVADESSVRRVARTLFEKSDGNVEIQLAILDSLRASGVLEETEAGLVASRPIDELELPGRVLELVLARLKELDPAERELVDMASVLGEEFEASLVAELTGLKRIRLLKQLASLERKYHLLVSAGRNSFRFAGRGLHDAVYRSVAPQQREVLHSRCADALVSKQVGSDREAYECVRHLLASNRVDETEPFLERAVHFAVLHLHAAHAATFLDTLLQRAPAGHRFEIAVRLANLQITLGRADEALETLAGAEPGQDDPDRHARLFALRAKVHLRTGGFAAATEAASAGLAVATDQVKPRTVAACRRILGEVALHHGDPGQCIEHWQAALALYDSVGDRRRQASLQLALGAAQAESGDAAPALEAKLAALDLFRELGDRPGEGNALNNLGNAYMELQRTEEALTHYEDAAEIGRAMGDFALEATALANRGRLLASLARIEDAEASLTSALGIYRDLGDPSGIAATLGALGASMAVFGQRARALTQLEEARTHAERADDRIVLARILRNIANLRHEEGDRAEAWEIYPQALSLATERERLRTLCDMGHAALSEGRHAEAIEYLNQSLAGGASPSDTILSLCRLARAHRAANETAEASSYAQRAEETLQDAGEISPQRGPEVYYSLGTLLEGTERGVEYMARASDLLDQRTRVIRSMVHRQNYLTVAWPNREILERARRLFEQ